MNHRLLATIITALLLLPLTNASLLNGSQTGANSATYSRNYQDMVAGMLQPGFNTTISVTIGGVSYLTVPEFASSTACFMNSSGLATTYAGTGANSTLYEVRSDAFSETGIVLAMSNQSTAFDNWYNFLVAMDKDCYGSLPCWVVLRNNSQIHIPAAGNDTASDGSQRSGIALYLASNNTAFTTGNRTKYLNYANQLALDSYRYETITTNKLTRSGINITRLPMGGGDCAAAGIGCSTDYWIGYAGDAIKFFQLAYHFTGNTTYNAAAANFTLAFLSVSLQNDTDGDGFGVAPFNYNWDTTGSYLGHTDGGGVNSYHYANNNPQWDDSDAPRFENFCDALRVANLTGQTTGPAWTNLSSYCLAWANTATNTNTTSCLQYFYNGTCSTSIRTGYYENGLGMFISTWYNTSFIKPKVDEILTHYSWSAHTMDSTSCGTAGMFRASKATKALGSAIGSDELWYSPATTPTTPSTPTPESPTPLTNTERTLFILMGAIAAIGTFVVTQDLSLTGIVGVTVFIIILAAVL